MKLNQFDVMIQPNYANSLQQSIMRETDVIKKDGNAVLQEPGEILRGFFKLVT